MATPSLDERLVSVDDSTPRVYDPVTRFRERNPHGHSSDSTIQHVLYGSGSGPACRPSTWEAQRAVRDLEEAAKFANQPDASAFYHEALELHPEACSLAFTMAFPDCDQSSFVDTLRVTRLRAPSDQPDSHDTPPLCASHAAPLTALIDCAVVRPLTSYIHLVDTALRDHLLYDHGLLEHFSCLRQVCFLEHSEFRDLLLDRLFQQATGLLTEQSKLHEATFLHDLMQSAASKFFTSSNETSDFEQFPFWATDCTPLVIRASIDLVPSKRESASKWITEGVPMVPSFNHITLVYRAPWPLNILINNRAMYKYNLIFRQLMHIKFIVWSLNNVYRWLRQNRYLYVARASSLADIHNITLWLHEMNQVLRGVEGYLTNQAIKASWSTFIARITGSLEASQQADWNAPILSNAEHVVHLDDLMNLHDTYLDNIIKCCLLDPANRELHQVFQGMLSCVHWFYKVLCSGHWISLTDSSTPGCSFRHSGWDQLHAAHQSFRRHARFLRRRVGRLLSAPGADRAQRSLSQFMFVFGLNDFYGQS
ncbi:unnamed protein product [Dicrocoelium dendriticum]|nr:unnamed protein product [Dicrocoelium dendriticum]